MSLLSNIVNASPIPKTTAEVIAEVELELAQEVNFTRISVCNSNERPGHRIARYDGLAGYGATDLEALGDLLMQGAFGKILVSSS